MTLWGLLVEVHTSIGRAMDTEIEQALGLPHNEFEVLLRLGRAPGQRKRMTCLAAEVSFTAGGFTRLADRMEQIGHIRREPDVTDRRATFLVMTESGNEVLRKALAIHEPSVRERFVQHMSDAERAVVESVLRRVRDVHHPMS
ncbi:MarR family transcriptional regulator [Pseudonocardiaceae bacterium YIM PH 21723]|nr:MarR family transcriptional regulator [Pseudonocardiaceae bacterium YIM PH 21723]